MQFLKNKNIESVPHSKGMVKDHQLVISPELETYVIGNKKNILTAEGTLTNGAMIIYIYRFQDGTYKLGQIHEEKEQMEKVEGRHGPDLWVESYKRDRRAIGGVNTLTTIIYLEKSHWLEIKQDQWLGRPVRVPSKRRNARSVPMSIIHIVVILI